MITVYKFRADVDTAVRFLKEVGFRLVEMKCLEPPTEVGVTFTCNKTIAELAAVAHGDSAYSSIATTIDFAG